jgi:hypothetical protein
MSEDNRPVAGRREIALRRHRDLLWWYGAARTRNRILFFTSQTLVIILSGLTPILMLWLPTESKALQATPAAVASILAGLMGLYQFNEAWIRWARGVEELRSEIVKFETLSGPDYPEDANEAELIRRFVLRIEQINAEARSQWAQQRSLTRAVPTGFTSKHDREAG